MKNNDTAQLTRDAVRSIAVALAIGSIAACSAVDRVVDLLTMRMGSNEIMVAARVDLDPSPDSDAVEQASAEIDSDISQRWPQVYQLFLDATRTGEDRAALRSPADRPLPARPSNATCAERRPR